MIEVIGPNWPSTRSLREGLSTAHEDGTIHWGASPCNKLEALVRMRDAGVYIPQFTIDRLEALEWVDIGLEVWGRGVHHTQGKDITRFPYTKRWMDSDFWVQRVQGVTNEWRVHVWNGRGFRIGVKIPVVDYLVPTNRLQIATMVRSARNGWQLIYSQERLDSLSTREQRDSLIQLAAAACRSLGVIGGGVDIITTDRMEPTVLEINTAPALGEYTLAGYIREIRKGFVDV
jgi:hypothetical protein